jgi:hypothetical protein
MSIGKTQLSVPFVCRRSVSLIPNLTPVISSLSQYSSSSGIYTIVRVYGNNFSLYGITGTSVINFGNFKNIPVSFYGSQEITFSVPTNALPGSYSVVVDNSQYPISSVSNSVNYTLT